MCGVGAPWRRVLLLNTQNVFGLDRLHKRCRGRGAECHSSRSLHVNFNARDTQGILCHHCAKELPLCVAWWTCVWTLLSADS